MGYRTTKYEHSPGPAEPASQKQSVAERAQERFFGDDPEELEFMGIHDYFLPDATCVVEWPERGFGVLPPADLVINIEVEGSGRSLELCAASAVGMAVIARLRDEKPANE